MDISEELNQIKTGLIDNQTVLGNLLKERDEFNKKIHVFIVLNIANAIKEMVDSDIFQKYDISSINIIHKCNDETSTNFIGYELFDSKLNKIEYIIFPEEKVLIAQNLNGLFVDLYDFSSDNISEELCDTTKNVKLVKGVDNELLDLLLSKDLKTTLDYSQLKISLPENSNKDKSTKSKL